MWLRLYKATGASMTAVMRVIGVRTRLSGLERLPDRPILFVVNHFTRFETFLIPYLVHRRFGHAVRTLATHTLFKGLFGRYLRKVGVVSIRDPHRNRTIIGDLMTGRANWVIYPEGGLIKNKKTVENGRLLLRRADRPAAPPRTGAAIMALKAELRKDRYGEACRKDDTQRRAHYEEHYDLTGPDHLAQQGTVIVPVNITYPRLRANPNLIQRLARLLNRRMDPRLDEELRVEGSILLGSRVISVHFGAPIEVRDYFDRGSALGRRVAGWLKGSGDSDLFLRRQARRLTSVSMRSVYRNTEVNIEHLFCYGLRALRRDRVPMARFRNAIFLAAMELRTYDELRLHPGLQNGIVALPDRRAYEPLDYVERLARNEGVLRCEGDDYVIDRAAIEADHDFHDVRVSKMVQVIANEIEPIETVVEIVRRAVNLDDAALAAHLPAAISAADRAAFRRDYAQWHDPDLSKPARFGEPFFLEAPRPRAGVVLAHGYLASPEQMRPFAEHLRAIGYSVYVLRLDAHGTAPAHLTSARWEEWLDALRRARAVIRHTCPRTFVGGFSLGGALAALLAAESGDAIDGVFLINTPVKLRSRRAWSIPLLVRLNATLRWFQESRAPAWRSTETECPGINYDVDYLWGLRELRRAMSAGRRSLRRVTAPALIVQADRDPLVSPRSAAMIHDSLGSVTKTLVRIPADHHVIVRGPHSAPVFEEVERFLERVLTSDHETPVHGLRTTDVSA